MAADDPLELVVRALRHRDLSAAALGARLERAGIEASERAAALDTLARVGYVDDRRLALARARTLADRAWGDAAIADDLERQGVAAELAADAIAALEPERERARRVVAARGGGRKTAGYLARKGFAGDTLETVIEGAVADEG